MADAGWQRQPDLHRTGGGECADQYHQLRQPDGEQRDRQRNGGAEHLDVERPVEQRDADAGRSLQRVGHRDRDNSGTAAVPFTVSGTITGVTSGTSGVNLQFGTLAVPFTDITSMN